MYYVGLEALLIILILLYISGFLISFTHLLTFMQTYTHRLSFSLSLSSHTPHHFVLIVTLRVKPIFKFTRDRQTQKRTTQANLYVC